MVGAYGIAAGVIGAALLIMAGTPAFADDPPSLSPAQVALFQRNHLKQISHPVVLDYSFHHAGGKGGEFDDKVAADIRVIEPDGKKDIWVDFLSGKRKVDFAPVTDFSGNPLLMFFLEHDVMEMHDATGGAALYFRNRIRNALIDQAEMHKVQITVDGAKHDATEIDLAPYRHDPHLDHFPAFEQKTYHFVLSDAVPGTIYQISTTVPDGKVGPAVFEETMTYVGEHPEKH